MIKIWIERKGDTFAVRWNSNGLTRIQTCETEDQARSFVAGMEEGLEEAQRILADCKPRFANAEIQRESGE